jgi:hypothetical protein
LPSRRTFLKTLGLLGLTACARPAADATPAAGRETGTPHTLPPTSTSDAPTRTAAVLPTPTRTACQAATTDAAFLAGHEVFRGDTSRNVILMTYDAHQPNPQHPRYPHLATQLWSLSRAIARETHHPR